MKIEGLLRRNTALGTNARGRYFTFCDDGDRWENQFVEEFVKVAVTMAPLGAFAVVEPILTVGTTVVMTNDLECPLRDHIKSGSPPVASQFYFVESLEMVGGYNEAVKSGVDHDLWFSLAAKNIQVKTIPQALSIQNPNTDISRITTSYDKRIRELALRWRSGKRIWFRCLVKNSMSDTARLI